MNQNYSNIPTTNSNSKKDRWLQALSASAALWLTVCLFGPLLLRFTFYPDSLRGYNNTAGGDAKRNNFDICYSFAIFGKIKGLRKKDTGLSA